MSHCICRPVDYLQNKANPHYKQLTPMHINYMYVNTIQLRTFLSTVDTLTCLSLLPATNVINNNNYDR